MVGDPAQTIHSFAGARASYLTGFAGRHPGATVIRLVRDYRSTPQVVRAANAVMKEAGAGAQGMGAVTLQAQRPTGPEPTLVESADEAAEAAGVADWIAAVAADGVAYREMAILFRINAQAPVLEQALAERKIPYLVRGGERFYERAEVRQALHALRTQARAADEADASGVEQTRAVLSALGWSPEPPDGAGAVRERWESLAALVSVAEDLAGPDGSRGTAGLVEVVAELERRAEAQQVPSAQGVTVSTLHSAKGLEWDAVALFGCQEGSLPFVLATTPEQVAEERRLLYVGITRARQHLRISWARTRNGGATGRKPSRFLDPLLPESVRKAGAAKPARTRGSQLSSALPVLRPCAGRRGRAQDRPARRLPGDLRRADHDHVEGVAAAAGRGRRTCRRSASSPTPRLVAIAEARPRSAADLIKVQGLGRVKSDEVRRGRCSRSSTRPSRRRRSRGRQRNVGEMAEKYLHSSVGLS